MASRAHQCHDSAHRCKGQNSITAGRRKKAPVAIVIIILWDYAPTSRGVPFALPATLCDTGGLKPTKLLPLVLVLCLPAAAQNTALPLSKETLSYTIEWRLITAGKATLQWNPLPDPKSGYQVNLHMESTGLVSKLYRVEDDYSAMLNQALCAESSLLKSHEGSRQRETRITFDAEEKKAFYQETDRVKNWCCFRRRPIFRPAHTM